MYKKKCKKCDNEFETNRSYQVFCSYKCKDLYWSKKSYWDHREKRLEYIKRDDVKERQKELKKTDKYKKVRNKNLSNRRKTDVEWKLLNNIKDRIRKDTNNIYENKSYSKENLNLYLGYNIEILYKKLFINNTIKQQYLDGKLELDHIIPYNRFIIFKLGDDEFKKCWNLKNLRLINKNENRMRLRSIEWDEIIKNDIIDLLPKGPDVIWKENKDMLLNLTDTLTDKNNWNNV